jgi:hypothetical protein
MIRKSHCKYGHEIAKVGRTSKGVCKECNRKKSLNHYYNNQEKLKLQSKERSRLTRKALKDALAKDKERKLYAKFPSTK